MKAGKCLKSLLKLEKLIFSMNNNKIEINKEIQRKAPHRTLKIENLALLRSEFTDSKF